VTKLILFDIDGSLTRGGGRRHEPHAPPEELAEALRAASAHQTVVLVTGQPTSVAVHMRQMLGGLNGAPVAPEFGSLLVDKRGHKSMLLTPAEVAAFKGMHIVLANAFEELGGELDTRESHLGINAFWQKADDFHAAKAEWERRIRTDQVLNHAFINGGAPTCRHMWHPEDLSANFLPAATGKQVAAAWARKNGQIRVAGGDTASDVPLLEAADFPLALHDEGDEVHPDLADIVETKGRGYVAPEHENHGHGALAGLRLAAAAGYIRL